MGITLNYVYACVDLFHYNVRKESYNFLKMAHDWSKVAPAVFRLGSIFLACSAMGL